MKLSAYISTIYICWYFHYYDLFCLALAVAYSSAKKWPFVFSLNPTLKSIVNGKEFFVKDMLLMKNLNDAGLVSLFFFVVG